MGVQLYEIGDLVRVSMYSHIYDHKTIYGTLVKMIDDTKNSISSCNIITGQGEKNTKLDIYIRLLFTICDYDYSIESMNNEVVRIGTHDFYKVNINNEIDKLINLKDNISKCIDIIYNSQNIKTLRREKINSII